MTEPTEAQWADLAARLQAPFAAHEVKQKKGRGGKQLSYIDARAVAARLDAVVGPGNWAFNWEPMVIQRPERGVVYDKDGTKHPAPEPEVDAVCVAKGILTIYGVSKADIGYAGPIEPNKASISNALRRCAALWGIGRYLYDQEQRPAQAQTTSQKESRGQSNGAQRSNASPGAVARPTGNQSTPVSAAAGPRVTLDQLNILKRLIAALGWGDTDRLDYLHQYHATAFSHLTEAQAATCITDLQQQAQRVQGAA